MEDNTTKKTMITIPMAAELLEVHPNTIRNYICAGYLPSYSLPTGKKILLNKEDVLQLIQKKGHDAKENLLG